MTDGNPKKRTAPYAPASAMSALFDHIRYVKTPDRVDSSLLQDYGISKSQAFPVLSTLKFLDVIAADGTPTPAFRSLQTGGEEFQTALREVVERAYSDIFSRLDVSRDTRDKIMNFFARNYSPATAERATALFLDLCGEAGIPTASTTQLKPASPQPVRVRERQRLPGGRYIAAKNAPPPTPPSPEADRVVLELRLTEDDLSLMRPEDIESVFAAAGKIEMARRMARAASGAGKADAPENKEVAG